MAIAAHPSFPHGLLAPPGVPADAIDRSLFDPGRAR
jgi:hypothetical protein